MNAARIAELVGAQVRALRPVGGGDVCAAYRVELADRVVFAKTHPHPPAGLFAAEARGLRWLHAAGGAPVPDVVAGDDTMLVLEWVEQGAATAQAAERLGRELAATHAAGAPAFGGDADGFIGTLPLPNAPGGDWPGFYATRRIEPYLRRAADRGAIDGADLAAVEQVMARLASLAGAPEPPARIHGDLWSGNVVWGADGRAWLVDPAAHGGPRESDLAMLALFGAPHLDRIIGAYDDTSALSAGWQRRVPLHQLHPLLVHAVLFGGGYGARAGRAARAALGAG